MPTKTHTYVHTQIPPYITTYKPTCPSTYIYAYWHTYIHPYIPTCLPTYRHTYLHTCKPTYMHTYMLLSTDIFNYMPTIACITYTPCLHTFLPLHTYSTGIFLSATYHLPTYLPSPTTHQTTYLPPAHHRRARRPTYRSPIFHMIYIRFTHRFTHLPQACLQPT